jgi:hypothetical protein
MSRPDYRRIPDDKMEKFAELLTPPSPTEGFDFVTVIKSKKKEGS